jgi:type II secretory pathway component GspD/PulD (secretin)
MKLKFAIIGLVAFVAAGNLVTAGDNAPAPATDTNAPAAAAPAAADPAAPATPAPDAATPAKAGDAAPATDAAAPAQPADAAPAPIVVAQANTATPAADTNAAPATPAPADAATAAPVHDPNAIIPLIVMDEVPLTDAIKNLARQAGLNYMLDPKINYGGLNADGTPKVQPSISLRWENLTADQALNAVLKTYNLVIQDDPKTKIALITIKDPAAPDPLVTKIIQLKYGDPTNMVTSVQTVLLDKRSKVLADVRTSQLVLVGTEKEIAEVDELVARLDTQTREVLIEAKLVEISKNPTTVKGIDWSGTLQAQHVTFGNNVTGGASGLPYGQSFTQTQVQGFVPNGGGGFTNGIVGYINQTTYTPNNTVQSPGLLADTAHGFDPATAFLNADGVSAVLSFLNTEADAKVLSTPRAVTLDNQEAVLSVTTAQPIFKTTAGTQGSPGGAEISYTNLGTILRVTPRISANATINLRVIPEVSDLGGTITKTVSGLTSQADFFDVRKVDTRVLIPSGNTLVMGGLVSDNTTKGNTKVPLLGDIPLLGWAFRQESKAQNKRNLLIFITPTIVQNEDFQPAQSDFLKTKMDDKPATKFGAWDSGNPQDWSKLFGSKKTTPDPLDDAK